jgi:hypothetical protein
MLWEILLTEIVFPFQTHRSINIEDKTNIISHMEISFISEFFLLSVCITNAISIIISPNRKLFFQNNSSIA